MSRWRPSPSPARGPRADDGVPSLGSAPRRVRADAGIVSLEFAMVVPVFFVLVLLLFELTGTARDALAVQNAAREGARVAATHASDRAVHAAVASALDGRAASVTVTPPFRRVGQLVRVRVTVTSAKGHLSTPLSAEATARVEPRHRR